MLTFSSEVARRGRIAVKRYELEVTPCPAPRMTKRDRWARRPPVVRYFNYRDQLKRWSERDGFEMPNANIHMRFVLPMPVSWSERKRAEMSGTPHQSKPDLDNLIKAFIDSLLESDQCVYQYSADKQWGDVGKVILYTEMDK